ncbi:MAG: hypothetical protein JNM89_10420 [Hyphomicrobiaceae bacterium]|nr:hypothetical protein [Hyphomicrobiaceae bacterium]
MDACETMVDANKRHECRNQVAFEKHVAVITIAAVVGAAAGYGIARAVKANPAGGALIGAFAGGAIGAAAHYSSYVMERANNDRLLAMDLVKQAIDEDVAWHRRTYVEINRDIGQSLTELDGIRRGKPTASVSISEQATRARELIRKIKSVDMGSETFIEAAKLYPPVITLVSDRRADPPMSAKIQTCREGADTLMRESVEQQKKTQASVAMLHKMGFFE